ncbi:31621_t:CDS:2, partial [Racocetra persica]
HENILEEESFIARHDHFSKRCEYYTLELVEKLGMKLYHKQLCEKTKKLDIEEIRHLSRQHASSYYEEHLPWDINVFNGEENPRNAHEKYIRKDLVQQSMVLRQKHKQIGYNCFCFSNTTLQNVKKDKKSFTSYVDTTDNKQQWQSRILDIYGFICQCDKCEADPQLFWYPAT